MHDGTPKSCAKHTDCPNLPQLHDAGVGGPEFVLVTPRKDWSTRSTAATAPGFSANYATIVTNVVSGAALDGTKRIYPWGDQPPTAARANLDWRAMGTIDVAACSDGDSAFGCRQMMGNVWEWTADTFEGFAGFEPGPYREYSYPLFGTTKVLRGGCWATRSRLIRAGYRNYYEPHRRDVWAGFRTCALR